MRILNLTTILISTLFLFYSCEEKEGEESLDDSERISSFIKIIGPETGDEILQGELVKISVETSGNLTSLTEVTFFVNDVNVGASSESPYQFSWNTSEYSKGEYKLRASINDTSGQKTQDEITVNIIEASVTDIDNNTYKIIQLGERLWMAENLAVKRYNDGSEIPHGDSETIWYGSNTPFYCWYNNDEATYKEEYGALYNWYVVETEKICPLGWHVPTDVEWTELQEYLIKNGYNYDGSTVGNYIGKSMASTSGWKENFITGTIGHSQNLNNTSGFNAKPSGSRVIRQVGFYRHGQTTAWWSSNSDDGSEYAYNRSLTSFQENLSRSNQSKQTGNCIRCIKDQ